jgi:hypothetical protein
VSFFIVALIFVAYLLSGLPVLRRGADRRDLALPSRDVVPMEVT